MDVPSFADFNSPQSWKRRKITNACFECHRRKQKCDRNQPCSNCIARNVVSKCLFGHPRSSSDEPGHAEEAVNAQVVSAAAAAALDGTAVSSAASESQTVDLGYSLTKGSNALVDLKQLVQTENVSHANSTAFDRPVQPPKSCTTSCALISRLPSRMAINQLVAAFFNDVNWQYSILEKYYFDCLFACWYDANLETLPHLNHEEISRELCYFPALLFQVLGLATQFLSFDSPVWAFLSQADLASCRKYSDTGIELMTHLKREDVALTAVQTDFLRASWLKNIGKGVEAWHSVGNAIRSAQELELHQQRDIQQQGTCSLETTLSHVWYEEHKRRLWMNLCIWDTFTSMILGRPRTIHPDDCDVKEPMECNIPVNPPISVPGTQEDLGERDRPNTISHNLFLYRLSNVWHTVKALKADRPCPKDYAVIQRLHNQVNSIVDRLPPTLQNENPNKSWDEEYPYLIQQREDILTKANLLLMALHRPHIEHHVWSRRAAVQAAIVTLDSQNRSFTRIRPHQYKFFGLSFYTIHASLLLSVVTAKYLPQKNDEVMTRIDYVLRQAMDRLTVMHAYSPIARSGLAILRQCYDVLKKRREGSAATLDLLTGTATELEDVRQSLSIDVPKEGLSKRQQQRQQCQQHRQEELLSSDSVSLSIGGSAPTLPGSTDLNSAQSGWTFDVGADAEFMPVTAGDPSLYLGPSTTDFDETYWMNLISQMPDIPNLGPGEADEIDGIVDAHGTEYDTVWDQIQLYD